MSKEISYVHWKVMYDSSIPSRVWLFLRVVFTVIPPCFVSYYIVLSS